MFADRIEDLLFFFGGSSYRLGSGAINNEVIYAAIYVEIKQFFQAVVIYRKVFF